MPADTAPASWYGKPLNPEVDGWHWLRTPDGETAPYEWRVAGECERGRWPSYWAAVEEGCWPATDCAYIAPCLTPSEHHQRTLAASAAAWIAAREACADTVAAKEKGAAEDPWDGGYNVAVYAAEEAIRALPPPSDAAAALAEVVRKAKCEAFEEAAKIALIITQAEGQRNAKDQWRESIGQEVAAAIRARGEGGE